MLQVWSPCWVDESLRDRDVADDRALSAQLQQAKTPGSDGKARPGGRPRQWSVAARLKPADGPQFCRPDAVRPDCLVATVAPGSLDGRSYAFDQVRTALSGKQVVPAMRESQTAAASSAAQLGDRQASSAFVLNPAQQLSPVTVPGMGSRSSQDICRMSDVLCGGKPPCGRCSAPTQRSWT